MEIELVRGSKGALGPDRRRNSGNERAENREAAIRCQRERKGEADGGGGGGGRHGEVETVAGGWTTALLYAPGRGSRRGSGEAGASETKAAKKERKPRGGDGGWVVFEKEEVRRVARD